MVRTLLVLTALAGLLHAHDVPIDPSLCAFEPLEIVAPAISLQAAAAPATDADRFRIVYDPGPSLLQFCGADPADPANGCADTPPRAFSGGGVSGMIDLSLFQGRMTAAGDIAVASAPMGITVGAQTETVPVALTTGLAVAGTTIAERAPLAADGSFTLVGAATAAALPPPLGGTPFLVRMTCRATPAPDLDQFAGPTTTKSFAGTITASLTRVRAVFRPGATTPDFTAPVLVRLTSAGTTVATFHLPGGLTAVGRRKFTGRSADGLGTITVRTMGRGRSYKLSLRLPTATAPATSGKRADAQLTYQVGGLLSRGAHTLRLKRGRS